MNIGTELLERVIGLEVDSIESANFNKETKILRYYLVSHGYDYPLFLSEEDLMILCKKNKISYNVLMNISKTNAVIEEIETEMSKLYENKYKYETYILDNSLIDLSTLNLNEIAEELESVINCFENIKFKKFILYIHSIVYFKDHSGSILYNKDGSEAFYRVNKAYCIRKPNLDTYRNENELVLDLLLNKLFHSAIK